jgi:hypothetical protein
MDTKSTDKPKFKITFKNSWWQCLVSLILVIPAQIAFALVFSLIDRGDSIALGNIVGLFFCVWLAYKLPYWTWKRKQAKTN